MSLSIDDLFVPAPSGVGASSAAPGSWLARILSNAETLKLNTTSWQSGGVARTILALLANMMGQGDAIVSIMAQGGFLDFAATGTVTFVALNGETVTQAVTPDPSNPVENPTGAPGWLDVLASSVYNVQRIQAGFAVGSLAIANTSNNTYNYVAGTYHAAQQANPNQSTIPTYTNTAGLTIPPGALPGTQGNVTAASNATPITITTASSHGLTTGQNVYLANVGGNLGANGFFTINVLTGTTFQLLRSSGTGSYTTGGKVYLCTTGPFQADLAGVSGNASIGSINVPITTNSGVLLSNPGAFIGISAESNTALASRCRLKLQALSPSGPKGAYEFFALSAQELLAEHVPPITLSGGSILQARVQSSVLTGVVTTTIANESPASTTTGQPVVSGITNLAVTAVTNANPIAITTASAHGLSTGDWATITGVLGNTNANGTFQITSTGANTFTVPVIGNGSYVSGGSVNGGDLGMVDTIIQANCVPDGQSETTQSALAFKVTVGATVVVPSAFVAAYTTAVSASLQAFFRTLPIGGNAGIVDINVVIGKLSDAGIINGQPSYVQSIPTVTLNGVSANASYPGATYVAVFDPASVIVVQGA